MAKAKLSKLRWRRLPGDVRAMCFADGCSTFARNYCKRQECRQPYCDAHKGEHILNVHTAAKLSKNAERAVRIPGFEALPRDRQIELLALIGKIRRCRGVEQSDIGQVAPGEFVAWAVVRDSLHEKRSNRMEEALQELYTELRALNPPPARGRRQVR